MSHKVTYTFEDQAREIVFTYRQFRNMHEAAAATEGIDIKNYLKMEQQIEAISNGKKSAVRNYRDAEFAKMGFADMYFHKNGGEE
ncbi:MAG: DUF2960 family protein [Saccharospirillaceae bacterium]|nr:DUF2960 domain-containing protein [Pseudomonadales bacterium]NRB80731.1 DUF2960 family protein [Saccharospirillaceae bacterium]